MPDIIRNRPPASSLNRLYINEALAFIAARGGEAIFKVAPKELVDKFIALLPEGVLDSPDRQKNIALFASVAALTLTRSAAAASVTEKFLIESLEEIALRKGEFVGSDVKKKALLQEAFSKRSAPIDALRAAPVSTPVLGINYPTAVAQLSAIMQGKHFEWLARQSNETRTLARDHGYLIATTPDHISSIMNAPESIRLELFKDMLLKSPKLVPAKSRLDSVLDKIGSFANDWIDPTGEKMTGFAKEQAEKTKASEEDLKLLNDIF